MQELVLSDDADGVAERCAQWVADALDTAIARDGHATIALSGGSTPRGAYERLARDPDPARWNRTLAFFSDERFIPPSAPESNLALARTALLDHVPAHVFPVPTGFPTAAQAADAYEQQIVRRLGPDPRFDIVLLGLGDDGHTASLFPGKPALTASGWVTHSAPGVLPPPVERITFTFSLINRARLVIVLVTGAKKRERLAQWLAGDATVDTLPIAGVAPTEGRLVILADREAAGAA